MSTNASGSCKTDPTTANRRTDPRPTYIRLGVDTEHASHVYRTTDETIHVVDADGNREHVEALDGRSVHEWMDYVRTERGWTTQYMFDSPGNAIAATLDP
jgi:hypothetical protein